MRIFGLGLLILLIVAGWGRADDTSYEGQGETVWPVGNDQIMMVSEKVVIAYNLKEDKFFTDCLFEFKNTGSPTELTVGFPDHIEALPWEEEKEPTIVDFRCWVDGKEVPTQVKAGIPSPIYKDLTYKRAFVWPMSFKEGETHKVRNTYSFRGMFNVMGHRGADYIMRTGKTWKGVIGKAEIVVQGIEDDFFVKASPGGYRRQGNRIVWHFENFKPDSDIYVEFNGGCQQWLFASEQLLKEKSPSPDSLFEALDRTRMGFLMVEGDSGVPEKPVDEMDRRLLSRLTEGPLKDKFLYRECLKNGDTVQAVTRWISSLKGRYNGRATWYPDGALEVARDFRVRPVPITNPAAIPESLRSAKPNINRTLMRQASLNPDTGRFVRSLKALEAFYQEAWDTTSYLYYMWPRLAEQYRSIGKFEDALRCYERGLDYNKRKAPTDTSRLADILKNMGQTMLFAGDTSKAIPYLEQASSYPKTPGGGMAASMLKRIKERREK